VARHRIAVVALRGRVSADRGETPSVDARGIAGNSDLGRRRWCGLDDPEVAAVELQYQELVIAGCQRHGGRGSTAAWKQDVAARGAVYLNRGRLIAVAGDSDRPTHRDRGGRWQCHREE